MKILHVAPLIEALREAAPGGAEQLCSSLAQTQAAAGHEVSVIAANGSEPIPGAALVLCGINPGILIPVDTSGESSELLPQLHQDRLDRENAVRVLVLQAVRELVAAGKKPDIIHTHAFDEQLLFFDGAVDIPLCHTLHCLPCVSWIPARLRETAPSPSVRYTTVSEVAADKWELASGIRPTVVENGLPLDELPFNDCPEPRYVWAGRISHEKGLHIALDLFDSGVLPRLDIFGRVYDQSYFQREIVHRLHSPRIVNHGFTPRTELHREMSRAKAVLQPILFDEPFGLINIEALATGTPVVSFRRGAAPNIIEHGVNGFVVDTVSELIEAIRAVDELDRATCRESVLQRFSAKRMANNYENLYRSLVCRRDHNRLPTL